MQPKNVHSGTQMIWTPGRGRRRSAGGLSPRGTFPRSTGPRRWREGTHVFDSRIECCTQRLWVISGVSEQGAALMGDDQRDREVSWIGVGAQIAAALHR